jgi:NADH-quinone oxidoreductase subunit M
MHFEPLGADLLTTLVFLPTLGALVLALLPGEAKNASKAVGVATSLLTFAVSAVMFRRFDPSAPGIEGFAIDRPWIPRFGVRYQLGVDGLAVALVLLTTLLTVSVLLVACGQKIEKLKGYVAAFLVLETGMLGSLVALDMLLFYVFWEVMLVPMYFIIGIWGGKRRIYATMKFFLFTMAGSLLMFLAILYAAGVHSRATGLQSFSLLDWTRAASSGAWALAPGVEALLFGAFALAFLVKVPLWPLHTWLPDAHVEAPTGGSVILAGVLLKLGTYGLLRFAWPLFPHAAARYGPLLAVLALVGIVYGAWVAAAQKDMKKLVAYSSVSHLALVVLGIVAGTGAALSGAIFQMIGHGLTTGLLFLLVGVLYERRHTREMADYGGIASRVPVTTALFLIATLGSVGLPGLNGFVGEFLILGGVFQVRIAWAAVAATGMVLGAIYLLTLVQKVFWGPETVPANRALTDVNGWELAGAFPIVVLIVLLGIFPRPLLTLVDGSVKALQKPAAGAAAADSGAGRGGVFFMSPGRTSRPWRPSSSSASPALSSSSSTRSRGPCARSCPTSRSSRSRSPISRAPTRPGRSSRAPPSPPASRGTSSSSPSGPSRSRSSAGPPRSSATSAIRASSTRSSCSPRRVSSSWCAGGTFSSSSSASSSCRSACTSSPPGTARCPPRPRPG